MKAFRKKRGLAAAVVVVVGLLGGGLAVVAAEGPVAGTGTGDEVPAVDAEVVWKLRMRTGPRYPSIFDLKRQADEGVALVLKLRGELQAKEVEQAAKTISVMTGYAGDATLLLDEFRSELGNERWEIRLVLARAYLKMGVRREESITALRGIVRDTGIKDVPNNQDGEGGYSPRVAAATILCRCGAKEAADDLWAFYQETKETYLALLMAEELGDERPRELVAKVSYDGRGDVKYVRLLGHYRVAEAVEPLRKEIAANDRPGAQLDSRRYQAEEALFRITGEVSHVQWLIDHAGSNQDVFNVVVRLKSPEVQAFLERTARSQVLGSVFPDQAFTALYASYPDDPVVRKLVLETLDGHQKDHAVAYPTIFEVAVRMNDPEVQAKGAAYAYNVRPNEWEQWYPRRNWPFKGEDFSRP